MKPLLKTWACIAVSVLALPAQADPAAKRPPNKRPQAAAATSSMDPPRMIEVRPGFWISSWSCVTDDGYGRLRDCAAGDGLH